MYHIETVTEVVPEKVEMSRKKKSPRHMIVAVAMTIVIVDET